MAICRACQQELPEDACFCGYCGSRIDLHPEQQPRVIAPDPALGADPVAVGTAETVRAEQPEEMVKTAIRPREDVVVVVPTDNRQFDRYPVRIDVTFSSLHNFFTGGAKNISRGGLFVATATPEPVGQRLEVTFTLPGLDLPSTVPCEVRWICGGANGEEGMGLRFLQLDRETTAAIDAFLAHRKPIVREEA